MLLLVRAACIGDEHNVNSSTLPCNLLSWQLSSQTDSVCNATSCPTWLPAESFLTLGALHSGTDAIRAFLVQMTTHCVCMPDLPAGPLTRPKHGCESIHARVESIDTPRRCRELPGLVCYSLSGTRSPHNPHHNGGRLPTEDGRLRVSTYCALLNMELWFSMGNAVQHRT